MTLLPWDLLLTNSKGKQARVGLEHFVTLVFLEVTESRDHFAKFTD